MKLLLLDIETAPNLAYVWGLWKQNVSINQIEASGYVLCWSAKWYGEEELMFGSIHGSTTRKMLKGIHKLLDEADAVISYNGEKFDLPTLNKEFIQAGMPPPSPYKQIDLLRTARQQFRFPSNKLDYVAKSLGLGEKVKHRGHELWVKCMAGDNDAWKEMETYNRQDVVLLERVYEKMLPWIKQHPNHGLYDPREVKVCTNCGSDRLHRKGFAYTASQKYQRFQCVSCGAWCSGTRTELTREQRGSIMRRPQG